MAVFISLLLIASGLALQILVPLHIVDFSALHFLGIPSEILGVFTGTALILIGIGGHYFSYYKPYADHLDALPEDQKRGHKK